MKDLKRIVHEESHDMTADGGSDAEQQEVSDPQDLLDWLKDTGVDVGDPQAALDTLSSQDLPNIALKGVLGRLNISMEQARSLGMPLKKKLTQIVEARFRESIAQSEWQERLQPGNIAIDGEASTMDVSPDQVSGELGRILTDQDLSFRQGTIWNAVVSDRSEWVAKYVKGEESEHNSESIMRSQMQQFQDVRSVMGDDLLLEQVAFKLKDRSTPMILQEKLDLDRWTPLGAFNDGTYDQVRSALAANKSNSAVLKDFLDRVVQLEGVKGLALDLSGDNIVFQLDASGKMSIKILDYGCTQVEKEEPSRLERLHSHAVQLRSLL